MLAKNPFAGFTETEMLNLLIKCAPKISITGKSFLPHTDIVDKLFEDPPPPVDHSELVEVVDNLTSIVPKLPVYSFPSALLYVDEEAEIFFVEYVLIQ